MGMDVLHATFFQDIVDQLLQWKQKEYEIVFMGDFNEDAYEERLATRFTEDDFRMSEQCLLAAG